MNYSLEKFKINNKPWDHGMWLKPPTKIYNEEHQRVLYKFRCCLDLRFAYSPDTKTVKFITWKPEKIAKYRLNYFYIVSDRSGRLLEKVLIDKQFHPHKDRKSGCLCFGEFFQNRELSEECITILILSCMVKYNIDDCFELPNLNDAKEITTCQIS